jgi:hypothetical protein
MLIIRSRSPSDCVGLRNLNGDNNRTKDCRNIGSDYNNNNKAAMSCMSAMVGRILNNKLEGMWNNEVLS